VADEHFKVKVSSSRFEDGTVAGQIVDQDPGDGPLKEGRTIKVILSKGPTPALVPDLTNLTEEQATTTLKAQGFEKGKVTLAPEEKVAKGIILDWSGKGEKVPKGTAIDLVVSSGPPPRQIDDWKGKTYDEAAAALKAAGLVPQRVDDYSDEVPTAGQVIKTEPPAGQKAEYGSTVKVHVSKGPLHVLVPDIVNMSEEQAIEALEAAGLTPGTRYGPPRKRVFKSDPKAGTKVERGTVVSYYTG
jgi:serine/threonine-protein kinase